nr:hypothetical protein [Gemmatimonadales bacterium]
MTAAIGAALPLQGAPPPVEGALVDPAAALPFLAALAAAVAAPVAPPIPVPHPVAVVAPDQADSESGADGEVSGVTGDGVLVDGAVADSAHPLASETERTPGTRRRVLVAERTASDVSVLHAVPRSAAPRVDAPTTAAAESDAAPSPDTAVGNADRAERAAALPVPAESAVVTPSRTMWQAALQVQPAPTRAASAAPPKELEAPSAAPLPTTARTGGESGRTSANATSVAAGVLAAMHAAHVAQADGARAGAPMVQFAEQVVATLTTQGEASAVTENAGDGVPAGPATPVVDAGDPAPLPTPLRVLVSARPASPQGEHDTTGDHRQDAPGEERQLVAPPPSEGVEAPLSMARGPWPGSEAATLPKRVDVATPTPTVHQTTEPPAAPPSPTSQVTIELDAERTGVQ